MKSFTSILTPLFLAIAVLSWSPPSSADNAPQPELLKNAWNNLLRYVARAREKMGQPPGSRMFEGPGSGMLLGTRLEFSLLARNRGSTSFLLGSDERSAVDFAKVRRSTRMAVERLTLGGGRLQPFIQVGAGEWRRDVDRRYFGDRWYGAQYGGGLQLLLAKGVGVAMEADQTFLRNPVARMRGTTLEVASAFVGLQVPLP